MDRVFNFSAGPSQMPPEVLRQAQEELLCYPGAGCSVMEMSHRTPSFEAIIDNARAMLRRIMAIPENYEILFLQGGATTQFSMVPMNLGHQGDTFAYMQTGQFADKAREEGARWGRAVVVASSKEANYSYIPKADPLPEDARFLHITGNNTIFGTSFHRYGDTLPREVLEGKVPLVADWSSAILGQWIEVEKHSLIYAGAQKNMGPAGLTVVILRKELLDFEVDPVVPVMLRYKVAAAADSMYNTPPTFAIYMAGLMFGWVEKMGGVRALEAVNRRKAQLLYDYLDGSALFRNPVRKEDRSIMNVTFTLPDPEATDAFLTLAKARGMINLKGHRLVGGCRASIYNGMPIEGVRLLVETMKDFETNYRG